MATLTESSAPESDAWARAGPHHSGADFLAPPNEKAVPGRDTCDQEEHDRGLSRRSVKR
jgi:hypothetical protein